MADNVATEKQSAELSLGDSANGVSGKLDVVGSQISVTPENIESVCNGLSPLLNQLNVFLSNNNLTKKDISFPWRGDKIVPFISCG